MLHTMGITEDEVISNGRFCFPSFKKRVIEQSQTGALIDPKQLSRLAKQLGCTLHGDQLVKKLVASFNSPGPNLKRRRAKGSSGYVYEKIS
ncbi:hypothetical protein [Vibrio alginolyticus]|uniref:hypothetical protein n=1 Tax=Vibrio TaxID=662 RepID=UPI0006CA6E2B|nr:hypothetical protein [Vibrio alginolyticus]KPM97594.1 hypothetical protein AOG25_14085 [Vibrio alginolyticus]CAH7369004.1 conserved hypothetical protein [Vibrio chagasii]